ncbi:MAG: hypothetical protein ACRD1H_10005 [Vicinamibacterales bacterium]
MTTLTQPEQTRDGPTEGLPRFIIAREGTELANTLRATGWITRAGWRTRTSEGETVWHLRFEIPSEE